MDDLKDKGYIDENKQTGEIKITPKTEQGIRKRSLEEMLRQTEEDQAEAITIPSGRVAAMK